MNTKTKGSIKIYTTTAFILVVAIAIALTFTLIALDPEQSVLNIILVHILVFVFCYSMTFLLGFYLRKLVGRRELANKYLDASLRQAFLFSFLIVSSLVLLSFDLFSLLNGLLIICALVFLEFYFLNKDGENGEPGKN